MNKKIICLMLIVPLVIVFMAFGFQNTISLLIPLDVEYIDIEHEAYEEILLGEDYKLYANAYPLNAQNSEIVWEIDNEEYASIKGDILTPIKEGEVKITARLKDFSMQKSFMAYISPYANEKSIKKIVNNEYKEEGISDTYYVGMNRFDNEKIVNDLVPIEYKIIPSTALDREVNFEIIKGNANIVENKVSFLEPGEVIIRVLAKSNEEIYHDFVYNVVDGVNIYNQDDLMKATNKSEKGEVVVLRCNLESEENINRKNTELFSREKWIRNLIDSTYDTLFYTNANMVIPKLNIGVNFKKDVYGNNFTINLHELCFPSSVEAGTGKPLVSKNDIFAGPLLFVSAAGLSVYGQDNIGFYVKEDNISINSVKLKNSNNVSDLTYLDYVGTTLEVNGENVTIKNSEILNGRTVVRSFSNENLLIESSLLSYAREFIFKLGSNSFIRSTAKGEEINNWDILAPNPVDENGEILSDSSATVKNSSFYKSGVFCIGVDTHFSGALLQDGTNYVDAAHDLSATSYASKLRIEGNVLFYDWKNVNDLDSSTLVHDESGWTSQNGEKIFDISKMIQSFSEGTNMIIEKDGNKYIHGGISFFGGGKNYSIIEFINHDSEDYDYYHFAIDDPKFSLGSILVMAVGKGEFRFYMYPNNYEDITIDSKPNINEIGKVK